MSKRSEQIFLLLMLCIACFGVFCVLGCGEQKQSCELPQCGSEKADGLSAYGVSIPGCGGCLTSGSNCGAGCLWPQSCKLTMISTDGGDGESTMTFATVDTRYFGGGCAGCAGCGSCGQREQSCYSGVMMQDAQNWGLLYGSTENDSEHIVGCLDGCGGCFATDGAGSDMISLAEMLTGVS